MTYDQSRTRDFSDFLELLAKALDISETQYNDAVERYEKLGAFLNEEGSSLAKFDPIISPQGSFALGTMIKPETDKEQYDVDLTCLLNLRKNHVTQRQLKNMVGDRLRESPVYSRILGEEKRRCWPLEYAEGTQFHMDVVPAIPDEETKTILLREHLVSEDFAKTAICITDKETWSQDLEWPRNNPKGYISWFKTRMIVRLNEMHFRVMALENKGKVEDIPEYKVKTPLQRAIQILKRHRDRRFKGDPDLKPISIIITTLAAHAYDNEDTVYGALMNLLDKMPTFIKYKNAEYRVENPVDPRENFADKWNKNPLKAKAFYGWLDMAKSDLKYLFSLEGRDKVALQGRDIFGESIIRRVMTQLGEEMRVLREGAGLGMEKGGLLISSGPTIVRPHQFSRAKLERTNVPTVRPVLSPISLVEQASALECVMPGAEIKLLSPHSFFYDPNLYQPDHKTVANLLFKKVGESSLSLVCDLNIRPSGMSREYWVRIFYMIGQRPLVFVKYPGLTYSILEPLPHFNPDNTLCLYHSSKEWGSQMYLVETIVPWASEWLWHYEIWKATGQWLGGGT